MMARRGSSFAARGAVGNGGSGVVLTLLPSTALYAPAARQPGENMLFLRWNKIAPPASLPLEKTWSDTGKPDEPGYFIFLDMLPSAQEAPGLEADLRGAPLPDPVATGFVWATAKSTPLVRTLLRIKLDANKPRVDGDTPLDGLVGFTRVGFGDGWPVIADRANGLIDGFVVTYPTVASARPPLGIALPMTGDGVGCVRFRGLIDPPRRAGAGASAVKALVSVSLDPIHPVDPKYPDRNYLAYTGAEYLLTLEGDGGRLSPVA